MNKPVFFIDTDTMNLLIDNTDCGEPQEEFDLIAEFTDIPYWAALHFLKTRFTVTVYRRLELHAQNEKVAERLGKVTNYRNGRVDISAVPEIQDKIGPMYWTCLLICDLMRGEDCEPAMAEDGGILILKEGTEWQKKPVRGKERPDLLVSLLFGGVMMTRPYMEDVVERDMIENMGLDEIQGQAENGDPASVFRMAMIYLNGDEDRGVAQNPEQAAYWFRRSADGGDPNAMFDLALHYAKGFGVPRSYSDAADWMRKAAEYGDPDAQTISEDFRTMAEDLEKAEAGDPEAQEAFAKALIDHANDLRQADSRKDLEEAADWLRKSLEQTGNRKTAALLKKLEKAMPRLQ